jgi:hypothetical protein
MLTVISKRLLLSADRAERVGRNVRFCPPEHRTFDQRAELERESDKSDKSGSRATDAKKPNRFAALDERHGRERSMTDA